MPYGELSESEKAYDRRAAIETLKAIVKLGYRIEPPGPVEPVPVDPEVPSLLQVLSSRDTDRSTLLSLWRTPKEDRARWSAGPEVYSRFAERMLGSGEPLLAYDLADEGLAAFPKDVRLRQLQALALARSGDTGRAGRVLEDLRREGNQDEETLGLLARTYKDIGIQAGEVGSEGGRPYLRKAFAMYLGSYERDRGIWTGINAASMALLVGDRGRAEALAVEVRALGLEALRKAEGQGADTYWPMATLGEAAMIVGDLDESGRWYARVAEDGWKHRRFGDLGSTRRQARLLATARPGASEVVARCFRSPRVAIFTGHLLDRPGRESPRFPASIEDAVRLAILGRLERSGAMIGFASAACGSDILFLECLLELGGEAHVILPYGRASFLVDSVEVGAGEGWGERFARVLERSEVVTASPHRLEVGGVSFEFANTMAQGLATLRAEQLDGELVPIAVWDGGPGGGPGGTASVVRRWIAQGLKPDVVDLLEIARVRGFEPSGNPATIAEPPVSDLGSRVAAILFGDVVGFSKLTEEQIPRFVKHYLGLVADRLARLPEAPVKKNTWGDGLFFVFNDIKQAGLFALDLRDRVVETRWEDFGLPAGLNMRIALHAGPVFECVDPVTENRNCIGTHVSHAARIEPITPHGQVYASQAFAAMAAAERIDDFRCHYVGQTRLAKDYGIYPTYHVRRPAD